MFLNDNLTKSLGNKLRRVVKCSTAECSKNNHGHLIVNRRLEYISHTVSDYTLEVYDIYAINPAQIRSRAGYDIYLIPLLPVKHERNGIVRLEHGYARGVYEPVRVHVIIIVYVIIIEIHANPLRRDACIQVAAPAQTFLLCHGSSSHSAAGLNRVSEVEHGCPAMLKIF